MTTNYHHLPSIDCHGAPRAMGVQYGEQAREAIRANEAFWGCERVMDRAGAFVNATCAFLQARAPDVLEELRGVAEGSGVSLGALVLANCRGGPVSPGCTSMAIRETPDGPLLGKNNDGDPDGPRFIVRGSRPDNGLPMVQATYAGWLAGLDAMNAAGLANGHNSVGSKLDRPAEAIDIRLWAYHLMRRCATTEELIHGLSSAPLTGKGFHVVVADAGGDVCALEAAVPRIVCRARGEPFVFGTNHYICEPLRDADQRTPGAKLISIYRYGYLTWRRETAPPRRESDLRAILSSHEPWAPCRHGGPHQSHTLWSMIAAPAQRRLLVAEGPPCSHVYTAYEVG